MPASCFSGGNIRSARFRARFTCPMSEIKGSIDVIVISSSDDEDAYQESDDDEDDDDDDEEEAEKSGMKRSGIGGEKKGAAGDVSPSSVEVKTVDEKRVDDDDCCILDFDPFDSTAADLESKLSLVSGDQEEEDVSVLAEKGEVACRDFPHARHMCAEFLFDKTSHESYCAQCYCYVCDTPAPCAWWKASLHSHCHASDQQLLWKNLRSVHVKREVKSNS